MKKKLYKTPLTGIVSSVTVMKVALLAGSPAGRGIVKENSSASITGFTGNEDEFDGDFD